MVKSEKQWGELNEIMQVKTCHSAWHPIGATHMNFGFLLLLRKRAELAPALPPPHCVILN